MNESSNTGMAVCTDRGDSLDVHPTRKQEVGERLARWALNKTYGYNMIPSGPLYRSVSFQKNVAYVSFDYADGMKAAEEGAELKTFEVAGEDQVFYPAKAVVEGNRVKVWSDQVKEPKIVRYGWQPFTRANLVNGEGLPASTFRSDI
jgi:sialate O-acetylesterase